MMTREQFEKTVLAMRAEGVPLTMPNLMLRTELPRGVIEDWLEDIDRIERVAQRQKGRGEVTAAGAAAEAAKSLREELDELRKKVVEEATARVVEKKLGWEEPKAPHGEKGPEKDLRWALGYGLVGGPFGLFYAAPFMVAGAVSAVYLLAAVALFLVPGLGLMLLLYLLPPVHFFSALACAAYAWRYNRTGSRSPLFPRAKIPGARKDRD